MVVSLRIYSCEKESTMSAKKSSIPNSNDFIYAVLKFASKRVNEFHCGEAKEAMARYFNLSSAEKQELTAGGNEARYKNRTSRAISDLKIYGGLLRSKRRGYYEITEKGKEELKLSNGRITLAYLQKKYSCS